ncbi:MAG: 30S ribosomal protein S17e [Candidatus Bathyarchaeia archaeon]
MGKVRPEHVKKVSRELIERYPERFTTDFQTNKKALGAVAQIYSPRLRNRVAGYITRLLAIAKKKAEEESEAEEGVEEGVDEEEEKEE